MIEAFTGYPGSGKTFALTYRAYKDLKRGYKVFANYPIRGAYKITFDDLINYTFPSKSTVIIDESGRWFNSRNWSKLPPAVFDLFTLHRHFQLDLIVAVQNFNRIDVALREVIELVWWARNYPYLPFFIYDGYYDVEALGLKGEAQKRFYISKYSKARNLYDTHIMKSVLDGKTDIPLIPWVEEQEKNKKSNLKALYKKVTFSYNKGNQKERDEEQDGKEKMPDVQKEKDSGREIGLLP